MIFTFFELLEHLVFEVFLWFLILSEQSANLGQLLEYDRSERELHLILEASAHLNRRARIGLQGRQHLSRLHLVLAALLEELHARREVFKHLDNLKLELLGLLIAV